MGIMEICWIDGKTDMFEAEEIQNIGSELYIELEGEDRLYIPLQHVRWYKIKQPYEQDEANGANSAKKETECKVIPWDRLHEYVGEWVWFGDEYGGNAYIIKEVMQHSINMQNSTGMPYNVRYSYYNKIPAFFATENPEDRSILELELID